MVSLLSASGEEPRSQKALPRDLASLNPLEGEFMKVLKPTPMPLPLAISLTLTCLPLNPLTANAGGRRRVCGGSGRADEGQDCDEVSCDPNSNPNSNPNANSMKAMILEAGDAVDTTASEEPEGRPFRDEYYQQLSLVEEEEAQDERRLEELGWEVQRKEQYLADKKRVQKIRLVRYM